MNNGLMLSYLKPLALGAVAYFLVKQFRKPSPTSGCAGCSGAGDESDVYARLEELRKNIVSGTERYNEILKRAGEIDLLIAQSSTEYNSAQTSQEKVQIKSMIAELLNERDQNLIETGLLNRNLAQLREQIIAEDARLKSAVVAPMIAERRSEGVSGLGLYIAPPPGELPIPMSPGWKDYKLPPDHHRDWAEAKRRLIKARANLDKLKHAFDKKWGRK